jgi:hypothetical protein
MEATLRRTEIRMALAVVSVGALIIATNCGWNSYSLGLFCMIWGPHALLLVILFALSARPASIAGASLAASTHFVAFLGWASANEASNTNGLAWLGYFCAIPGGAICATIAAFSVSRGRTILSTTSLVFGVTLFGFLLNQGAVCMTVLHCV